MADLFHSCCEAIITNDRTALEAQLGEDSTLATHLKAGRDRLEPRMAHYLYKGDTLLHVAAAAYRVELGKVLLAAGARVAAADNRRRSQPLHYAADGFLENPNWNAARQVKMIHLLLEAGANIVARDQNGATPLHRAVRTRCTAAVCALLDAGADPTLRNEPGSTPFHLVVQNTGRGGSGSESARAAQREIIRTFLKHGIPPTLRDGKGRTVLAWATSDPIRQLLVSNRDE